MIRRILIAVASILLVCACILTICHYYGRVETSAPQWVVIPAVLLWYAPGFAAVCIANEIWKRIQEHRSFRAFLIVIANIILFAFFFTDALIRLFRGEFMTFMNFVIVLLAVNIGNLIWKKAEGQKTAE